MRPSALVTGGAGFIGSHLVNRLVEEGWEVDVVDDLSAGKIDFLERHGSSPRCRTFYHLDFADEVILTAIKNNNYDRVFHLAAMPRVGYSVEFPVLTHDVNVTKSLLLLDACKNNIGRFINTSSSSVYGNECWLPTTENDPHSPKSPYALQKSIIEQYCKLYSNLYELDTVSIRPFNVFGPHQLGNSAYSCAISAWLYALKHNKPLRSDGTGEQSRDLIYVDDLIDIFIKVANSTYKFKNEAFNAGLGKSFTNKEILSWFKERYPNIVIENAPARPGDVRHTLADNKKTRDLLKWEPKTSFWFGLEKTRDWALSSPFF